jgi:Phosphoenolpyruvate phosphomutase
MLFLRRAAHRERGISSGEITMSLSTADKRRAFRKLHESGCFAIPNPWDAGSALYLQSLGFKALASTSSGFAWSRGRADNTPTRAEILAHLADLAGAIDVPLNADFENGFGADAAGVAESVRLAVESGIAGLSIEDSIGPRLQRAAAGGTPPGPLFALEAAVERIRAARRAIMCCWSDAPRASSWDSRTSTRRLRGSSPTRTPVPIACMRPAYKAPSTSVASSRLCIPSP